MKTPPTPTVRVPDVGKIEMVFEAYTTAVGKVVHAWNYLQERLGRVFVIVTGMDRQIALAVWYSTGSDRSQRSMLKAAVLASAENRWADISPNVRNDLIWLLSRADALAEERNNAVHAPCSLVIDAEGPEIAAPFYASHPRARKLIGARLLVEFDWAERAAETLTLYAEKIETGLSHHRRYTWPDRPSLPDRKPRKTLQDQPRPPRTRSRQPPPQASQE